jgi:Ca-activated chloride channel family protein
MSMQKWVTMRHSSNALGFRALLATFVLSASALCWSQTAPASSQAQSSNSQAQQPVQDLTPPSDAEAERAAPVSSPNQPSDTTTVKRQPGDLKKKDDQYVFRAEVEEVILYATVVDPRNKMISSLDRNAFTVYEDGQPQKITSFRQEDIPVSLGVLIDNSGSMRGKRNAVNQASLNLVRASNPKDEVFIVNFNDEPYLDQDFTSNIGLLKEGLEHIEARGGTAMYDAVVAASDHLAKGAKLEKKVLLVVTDGEDNASRDSLEEAVRRVQGDAGPTIYTIGLLGDDRNAKRARRALERLALETGGVAYFPRDLAEVDEITKSVAHDIRNQYTIGYKPTRPQSEGGFRTVKVEAKGEGRTKLQVRTRSGYFASQKQAAASQSPTSSSAR